MPKQLTEAEREAANQKARARSAERRAEKAAADERHRQELRARWLIHDTARERAKEKVVVEVIRKLRPDLEIPFICGEAPQWFRSILRECRSYAGREAGGRSAPRYADVPSGAEYSVYLETTYLPAYAEAFTGAMFRALRRHDRTSTS